MLSNKNEKTFIKCNKTFYNNIDTRYNHYQISSQSEKNSFKKKVALERDIEFLSKIFSRLFPESVTETICNE